MAAKKGETAEVQETQNANQNGFAIERIPADEAKDELSDLKSNRGGRNSKYSPVAKEAEELTDPDDAVRVTLTQNEVAGLRGYLQRHYGDRFTVRSSKLDDGNKYAAFVFLTKESVQGREPVEESAS